MFVCRVLAGVAASTWVAFTVMFTGYFPEEESGKAIAQINGFNNTGKLLAFFLGSASATMQDLDIRGAGNILGAEQSGFISEIGYETYQRHCSAVKLR